MKLTFNSPANRFFEGLPLGNGSIGTMLLSGYGKDTLRLYHNTYFSGERSYNTANQKNASKAFLEMRELCRAGKYKEAKAKSKEFYGIKNNYGTNLPIGEICVEYFASGNNGQNAQEANLTRQLDIINGIASGKCVAESKAFFTEALISYPKDVLAYSISSDTAFNANLNINVENSSIHYEDTTIYIDCQALEHTHSDNKTGTKALCKLQIQTDGEVKQNKVSGATYIKVYLQIATDFDGSLKPIPPKQFNYEEIKKEHTADFREKMERVHLQLEEKHKKITELFQYGRYLLLCSSRENSLLPAHLQGIWNDNVACKIGWTCDMHLDINTQMNYFMAQTANLYETTPPLLRYFEKELIPSGRITAQQSYGLEGFACEIVSNSWGHTAPYWASELSPCPTGGAWLLINLWEHYLFTQDTNYLKQIYPIIKEATQFFASYVFYDDTTKTYATGPSISPENSFEVAGEVYQISNSPTYEVVVIRELFNMFLQACQILGIKDALTQRVEGITLPKYRLLKDGSIAEWAHNHPAKDTQHRHTSHLLGLYPFAQIDVDTTKDLAQGAKKVIANKLANPQNWEDTGWARNMLLLYSARLKEGEEVQQHINSILEKLTEENYMIIHPPTRGAPSFDNVYELDGNTGFTAGICEALLQSHNNIIRLLPALPKSWAKGKVCGLRCRGDITAELNWEKGELTKAVFESKTTQRVKIIYKNTQKCVTIKANTPQEFKV